MTAKQLPVWHCTAAPAFWPGCGRCGPCRELAPEVFGALGEVRKGLLRAQAAAWDYDEAHDLIEELLGYLGER
jgi:NADH:ubiquinone oxidoreductase subunit F (NADH-binding)